MPANTDGGVQNRIPRLHSEEFADDTRQDGRMTDRLAYHRQLPGRQQVRGTSHLRGDTLTPNMVGHANRDGAPDVTREPDTGKPIIHFPQAADPGFELRDILRSSVAGLGNWFDRLQSLMDSARH